MTTDAALRSRMSDVVFASSASVRDMCNDSMAVVRLRTGVSEPMPFNRVVEVLRGDPALRCTLAYKHQVKPLVQKIAGHYPSLSKDELEALTATTLESPPYYKMKNTFHYAFVPGDPAPWEEAWASFTLYVDLGIEKLASRHRDIADGLEEASLQASPLQLQRVAGIPVDIFTEHFNPGNKVVFKAPMSAAELPQWDFIPPNQPALVPALLQFDGLIARTAAQLGAPDKPISVFGPSEGEWLIPRNTRCIVKRVYEQTERGRAIKVVELQGMRQIQMLPSVFDREMVPLPRLLQGAAMLAAFDPGQEQSPLLETMVRMLDCLGKAAKPKEPDSIEADSKAVFLERVSATVQTTAILAVASPIIAVSEAAFTVLTRPILALGWLFDAGESRHHSTRDTAFFLVPGSLVAGSAVWAYNSVHSGHEENRVAKLREDLRSQQQRRVDEVRGGSSHSEDLQTVDKAALEEALRSLEFNPTSLSAQLKFQVDRMKRADADCYVPWAALMSITEYIGRMADDPETVDLYENHPFSKKRPVLNALEDVGNDLWSVGTPADAEIAALHTWAWEDVLRAQLASVRMLLVGGLTDVGKTTFLKLAYNIKAASGTGGKNTQTDQVNGYRHPAFDAELCPAYIFDSPGYADRVAHRNDAVRLATSCASAIPDAFCGVWIFSAEKHREQCLDEVVFRKLLPAPRVVVVTKVDLVIERDWKSKCQQWEEEGVDDDDIFEDGKQEIMDAVKTDLEDSLRKLCGAHPLPPLVYAVLNPQSWASSEEMPAKGKGGGKGRDAAPWWWPTAKADVQAKFRLVTSKELRVRLDRFMGIV